MPIEQEPIKIIIPVEDEDEQVLRPETSRPGITDSISTTGRDLSDRARTAWESEQRRHAQAMAEASIRKGAEIGQTGLVKSLNWLSDKLAELANRINTRANK